MNSRYVMKRLNYLETSKIDPDLSAFSSKGNKHDSLKIYDTLASLTSYLVLKKDIKILIFFNISSDTCFLF